MSIGAGFPPPRSGPAPSPPVRDVRDAARRQTRRLSGGLVALLGGAVALVTVAFFFVLDYQLDQDPHRLFKILAGVAGIGLIVLQPGFGLLLFPVATPFIDIMPRLPVPGVNTLNILLLTIFFSWALGRVIRRESLGRFGRLTWPLVILIVLAALSIVRGAAFPTGLGYEPAYAGLTLFRSATTFAGYFIVLAMMKGEKDRRWMAWSLVIAVLAEGVVTAMMGRNVRGRAVGTIGQSNDLGAYLAMFTVFAVALLPAVKAWGGRLLLVAAATAGAYGVLLTVSRGAIVATAAGLIVVALRSSRALTLIVFALLLTSPLWTPDYVKERLLSTQTEAEDSDDLGLESSAQLRVDTWSTIMTVVSDHLIEGVGFTGLGYVLPETGEALGLEVKDSAHNTFLRMLAEMGIAGLLIFLWVLWATWSLAQRGIRAARTPFDRQIAVGVLAALVGLAISCWFGDRFFNIFVTGNLWIACALVDDILDEARTDPRRAAVKARGRRAMPMSHPAGLPDPAGNPS